MAKRLQVFAWVVVVGLATASCDESKISDDVVDVKPGVGFISMEALPLQGALPLNVEVTLEVQTKDPRADVMVTIDYGDGESQNELTTTSLPSDESDPEVLMAAETRKVVFEHTYDDKGVFKVRVDAIDITNSTEEKEIKALPLSVEITAENLPDLIAVDVSSNITELDVELPFDITYQVFNNGSSVVTDAGDPRPFDLNIYLVDAPNFQLTALVDSQKAVQLTRRPVQTGLDAGSTLTETVGVRVPEAAKDLLKQGTWYVAVWVDPDNDLLPGLNIVEQDETNNFKVNPAGLSTPELPDLVIDDVSFTNQPEVERLTQLRLDLTISNIGRTGSEGFFYDLYLSRSDTELGPDDIHLALSEHTGRIAQGLDTNQTSVIDNLVFSIDPPITDPDEFYIIARIDGPDDILEVDEDNNILADDQKITVRGETMRDVDIVVENFSVSPSNTYIGGQLDISFDLKNTGTDSSGEFNCEIYLSTDSTLETNTDVFQAQFRDLTAPPTGLASNVAKTVFVNVNTANDYFAFVFCDPTNIIAETDEDNNLLGPSGAITIAATPDLDYVLRNLVVTPASIIEGDNLMLEFDVCNEGNDFAGPVLVEAFLSADDAITTDDLSIALTATTSNALPPGDCEGVTISAPITCLPFVDTYTAGIIVDASEQIDESDETNNLLVDTVGAITVANKDINSNCTCTEDGEEGGSDNNDQTRAAVVTLVSPGGGDLSRSAKITDLGMCDGTDFYTLELERGDGIDVKLINFDTALGDLDLRVYDAINLPSPITSDGLGNLEQIKHVAADVDSITNLATLYIEVFPKQGGERNRYDLDIVVTPKPLKAELQVTEVMLLGGRQPNIALPYDFEYTLYNDGKTDAPSFDTDIYLSADTNLDTTADILLDTLNTPGLVSFTEITVPVTFNFPAAIQSGLYYIIVSVDPADAVDEADEINNVQASLSVTIDTDCIADAYEGPSGNDTLDLAYKLDVTNNTLLQLTDVNVCNNGRADVYLICVTSGGQLNHVAVHQPVATFSDSMSITLLHRDKSPIDDYSSSYNKLLSVPVPIYSCTGNSSCKGGETCQSGFCADASGRHCILAQAELRSSASVKSKGYTLLVDTVVGNQRFEPGNDSRNGAVKRTPGPEILAEGSGHSDPEIDEDWYYLDLKANTVFDLNLLTADLTARTKVYYTGGSSSGTTVSPMTPKSISISVDERVFFKVYKSVSSSSDDRPTAYGLEFQGIDGLDLVPVNLTADLSQATASDALLVSWTLENTRLTPVEISVNYRYWLSEDNVVDAGDYALDIAGGSGTTKSVPGPAALSSIDVIDKIYLSIPISVFGNFRIIVDVDPDDRIPDEFSEDNNLDNTPITLTHSCVPDTLEANNSFGTASVVTAPYDSTGNDLTVCSGDNDFFTVDIPDGVTYTFAVTDMVYHNTGDLDVFLYDASFLEIDRSDKLHVPGDDTETITYTNSSGGVETVYFRIAPFGNRTGITNIYNVTIN